MQFNAESLTKGGHEISVSRPIFILSAIVSLSLLCSTVQVYAQFNAMAPQSSWSWNDFGFDGYAGDSSYNYGDINFYDHTNGFGLANPAAVYCEENGGTIQIRHNSDGDTGYCVFPDGSSCEEWDFFYGICSPKSQETKESKQFIIYIEDRDSMGLPGAEVFVDGTLVGKTDNNGKVIATVTFDAHVVSARADCGEAYKVYYFDEGDYGVTLHIDTCSVESSNYIDTIIQGEITRILEFDESRYVFEVHIDKVISDPGNFVVPGQYLTIIVPEGGYTLVNHLQVGKCVEARGKWDTELYCGDGAVREISCTSDPSSSNPDTNPLAKIAKDSSYIGGNDLTGNPAYWRHYIDSYPPEGPALYILPQNINAQVCYEHNFGSMLTTHGRVGFTATLEVWNGDYIPYKGFNWARCEKVSKPDYGCFGGEGRTLQLNLPKNAKKGWYDARIRLYYNENFSESRYKGRPCEEMDTCVIDTSVWTLADEVVIHNAFRVIDESESSSDIKFKGTVVERHEATGAGEASYWTVTVDQKISGPDPLFSPLKVITYQAISPSIWGQMDPTIRKGDEVEVYGKYDEHTGCYGNCYVTLHGSEDYYIKKDGTFPDQSEIHFPPSSSAGQSPSSPSTGSARVIFSSNSLRGYSVFVDGSYVGGDGQGGDPLDGTYILTVSGDQYHTLEISSGGQTYSQQGTFLSGYTYTLSR